MLRLRLLAFRDATWCKPVARACVTADLLHTVLYDHHVHPYFTRKNVPRPASSCCRLSQYSVLEASSTHDHPVVSAASVIRGLSAHDQPAVVAASANRGLLCARSASDRCCLDKRSALEVSLRTTSQRSLLPRLIEVSSAHDQPAIVAAFDKRSALEVSLRTTSQRSLLPRLIERTNQAVTDCLYKRA